MKFKGKEIKVILSEEAAEEYDELNRIVGDELQREVTSSVHQSIFRSVERVKGWLQQNPFAGEQVQKSLIPDYYAKNFAGCKTPPFRAKFLHAKNTWLIKRFHAFLSS
ncbi:MAG TPA: hypothetical protein VJI15_04795 [Candidatus Nanoarchaeia archaeon]|nr:hypothetical protein [Candidatus Nanoarchaeia archaeon]